MRFDTRVADEAERIARGPASRIVIDDDVHGRPSNCTIALSQIAPEAMMRARSILAHEKRLASGKVRKAAEQRSTDLGASAAAVLEKKQGDLSKAVEICSVNDQPAMALSHHELCPDQHA